MESRKLLNLLLYLLSIHSICVGLALIFTPAEVFAFFGYFPVTERFFPIQGGIFHIIMGIAYYMAARLSDKEQGLILLTIVAKFMATIFLIVYFLLIHHVWMVLLSGIVDGLMAAVILIVYLKYKKEQG